MYTKIDSLDHQFSSQQAADAKIKSFDMLTPCSHYLKLFLCSTYKPSCHQVDDDRAANLMTSLDPIESPTITTLMLIRPCRSLCTHVYKRCYPLMERFKRPWPFNCSQFLDDSTHRCMNDPAGYLNDSSGENESLRATHPLMDLLLHDKKSINLKL
jgi:hypothetical protein